MLHVRSVALVILLVIPSIVAAQRPDSTRVVALDTVRVSVESRTASASSGELRSTEVIDREEIARHPARSIAELLATRLGFDVNGRSPASADLALRGASIEQVLVLVDGVRVSDRQSGHFSLDLAVPLADVERIEVLRGTGSTLYGPDAIGGVVNIVTRKADGPAHVSDALLRGGSFGTAGLELGANAGSLRATVNTARSDGHRPGTDYRIGESRVSWGHSSGIGHVAVDAGAGIRDFGASEFYGPYPSYERTETETASLRWSGDSTQHWRPTVAVATRHHRDHFVLRRSDPSYYENFHTGWQTNAELVARRDVGIAQLALGGDGEQALLRSARLGDHDDQRGGVFGEMTIGRPGSARVDLGARGDWSSRDGNFFSPSLAAALPLTSRLALRGSVSRGFRAPTWTDRFYRDPANVGDSTLVPERFWAEEVGMRASLTRGTQLDATAFMRQADALIDWAKPVGAPASTPWHTMNVGHATFRGVEGALTLPSLIVPVAGVTTWRIHATGIRFDAAGASGYVGKYALRPITRQVGLSTGIAPGAATQLTIDVSQAQRAREGSHLTLDARASWRWRTVSFELDGMNLTGADYLDAAAMPVPGRAVYAAVQRIAP